MILSQAARVVAWLGAITFGLYYGYLFVASIGNGILPGHELWDSMSEVLSKTGQAFVFSIALGVFAEISLSLATLARAATSDRNAG